MMESVVSKYLEELNVLRKDVCLITLEISRKKEEYETIMNQLRTMLSQKDKEINELRNSIIFTIRLGDLLCEISKLSGVKINDMEVSLETNVAFLGEHDFGQMFKLLNESKCSYFIRMKLTSIAKDSSSIPFHYFCFLPLDFKKVQSDGMLLVDHCSLTTRGKTDEIYTEIDIDRNVEDIVLNFNLSCLEMENNTSWYPSDLFSQALVNCIQKKDIKVRRRFG